jgi:hypothetical protein
MYHRRKSSEIPQWERDVQRRTAQRRLAVLQAERDQHLTPSKGVKELAEEKLIPGYLRTLPEAVPDGQFLVHNSVRPTHPLGLHGFRAWLQTHDNRLEPCNCGWSPQLGTHYRVKPL